MSENAANQKPFDAESKHTQAPTKNKQNAPQLELAKRDTNYLEQVMDEDFKAAISDIQQARKDLLTNPIDEIRDRRLFHRRVVAMVEAEGLFKTVPRIALLCSRSSRFRWS